MASKHCNAVIAEFSKFLKETDQLTRNIPNKLDICERISKSNYMQDKLMVNGEMLRKRHNFYMNNSKRKTSVCYISILDTLKSMLSLQPIRDELYEDLERNQRERVSGRYTGFKDGSLFQPEQNGQIKLRIQLYMDDFTASDSLSSSAPNSKISAVYFILDNLPYYFQSSRNSICLCLVGIRKVVNRIGLREFLQPLLTDLILLRESGFDFGLGYQTYGYLSSVVGDNLATNEMMGITMSFRSNACKSCDIAYRELNKHPGDPIGRLHNRGRPRVLAAFNHLWRDETNRPSQEILNQLYIDVIFSSVFDDLQREALFTFDTFHDLEEGVIPLILTDLVKEYFLSDLDRFNLMISQYGFKNGKIQDFGIRTQKVRGTGCQMLELFVNFSTICMNINKDTYIWKAYIALRDVLAFTKAQVYYESMFDRYREKVATFIRCYQLHYHSNNKQRTVTMKMHHLHHYPEMIKQFGSLMLYSSLRHERVHQTHKTVASYSKNRIDLPYTLASSYQRKLNFESILPKYDSTELQTIYSRNIADHIEDEYLHYINRDFDVIELKSCIHKGVQFERNAFYAKKFTCSESNIENFKIVKLLKLFVQNERIKIICQVMHIDAYIRNLCCWKVSSADIFTTLNPEKLYYHCMLEIVNVEEEIENQAIYVQNNFYFECNENKMNCLVHT